MARGKVIAVDPVSRVCDVHVFKDNATVVDLVIPPNLNFLESGYIVNIDSEAQVVTSIISFDHTENLDPLGTPKRKSSTTSFISSGVQQPGDYLLNIPEAGYIGLLKGFIGIFGSSPLAQVMTFGTRKLVKVIAKNFEWEGGQNFKVKIETAGKHNPTIFMKIGSLEIRSDTTTNFIVTLKSIFMDQIIIIKEFVMSDDSEKQVSKQILLLDEKMRWENNYNFVTMLMFFFSF